MMNQEQREKFVDELLKFATPEEETLYCKVYETSEDRVFEQLGKDKKEIIRNFIVVWMMRMEEAENAKTN